MEQNQKKNHSAQDQIIHEIRYVTFTGMALNMLLVFLKTAGGLIFHSQALVADGIHSLSDLTTDFALIFGVKYWTAPPDKSHPYGHGRIETLISAFIGLALIAVAGGLIWNAVSTIRSGNYAQPELTAFAAAVFSVVSKEWLFHWTKNHARKVKSTAMEANAWHHRSDALSSIPAAIAIAIACFFPGLRCLDEIGAIVVSLFIFYAAYEIILPTLRELSDAGVSRQVEEQIYRTAAAVPGILCVHAVRTRNAGSSILADLHIEVDPEMTVREGHELSHHVKSALLQAGLNITDAVVHIEPYTGDKNLNKNNKIQE